MCFPKYIECILVFSNTNFKQTNKTNINIHMFISYSFRRRHGRSPLKTHRSYQHADVWGSPLHACGVCFHNAHFVTIRANN